MRTVKEIGEPSIGRRTITIDLNFYTYHFKTNLDNDFQLCHKV